MESVTMTVEAENADRLNAVVKEARRMLRKLSRKSEEPISYVILAVNMETGKSREIVSRSLG